MAVINNIATENGDILQIKTSLPLIGVIALSSFIDSTTSETSETYFTKEFRYSLDNGISWENEWQELTDANLQLISVEKQDPIFFEYKYTRVGEGEDIGFNFININSEKANLIFSVFDSTFLSEWVYPNEVDVLGWAINVLEKIMGTNYTAFYLERSKDMYSYFFTVTTIFAMLVVYCRRINDTLGDLRLAKEFLTQLGLYVGDELVLDEVVSIIENYVVEFSKRGTNQVFEEGEELSRLISYEEGDENINCQTKRGEIGWCLGHSSPMYNTTEGIEQAIKGYEKSDNVIDESNYPVWGNTAYNNSILIFKEIGGVGYSENDLPFFIPIDNSIDYEISVRVKGLSTYSDTWGIDFGVRCFTEKSLDSEVQLINSVDGTSDNRFLESFTFQQFDKEIWIRGILRKEESESDVNDILSMGFGNNLILDNSVKYVIPFLITNSEDCLLTIRSLHIKPLYLPNNASRGILGMRNLFYFWLKNNSNNSSVKVTNAIGKEILPYSSLSEIQYLE